MIKEAIIREIASRTRLVVRDDGFKDSAVLVPIFEKEDQFHILFTTRADNLEHHKGQVSFPGGGAHPEDSDLQATALRESREEIGLKEEDVEVLGTLDDVVTLTSSYRITPFVGLIPYPYVFTPAPHEVQDVFSFSIEDLTCRAKVTVDDNPYGGMPSKTYAYEIGGRIIWGATAWILTNFLEIVKPLSGAQNKS